MSIARHAAVAAVTGTIVVAVAVVLLSNGVPGADRTSRAAGSQPVASSARPPGATAANPAPARPAPAAAPTGAPAAAPGPNAAAPNGAAPNAAAPNGVTPKLRPGDPRLGPFEAQASCLRAGNAGMGDGSWEDYECVGGPGNWRIEPKQ